MAAVVVVHGHPDRLGLGCEKQTSDECIRARGGGLVVGHGQELSLVMRMPVVVGMTCAGENYNGAGVDLALGLELVVFVLWAVV